MAFRLLSILAEQPGRIVSKEELYNRLWGGAGGGGTDPGPYEHQLADHKRKILVGIEAESIFPIFPPLDKAAHDLSSS